MEPYKISFNNLKSVLQNLKMEIVFGTFPLEKTGYDDIIDKSIDEYEDSEYAFVEERYEVKINDIFINYYFDEFQSLFDELNSEIIKNLQSSALIESMQLYNEELLTELIEWYNNIVLDNIILNGQYKWFYLPKNINKSILQAEGISIFTIERISDLFLFVKERILETIENIQKPTSNSNQEDELNENQISAESGISDSKSNLDIYQSAILFYYLKKHRAIKNLTDESLSTLVSSLTGHSKQNIRTNKGFGAIGFILADKSKNQNSSDIPNLNLNKVKNLLHAIIGDIEIQCQKNHPDLEKK